jgi:hypothetical protein
VRPGKHGTLPTLFAVGSALVFAFHARAINPDTCFNRIFTSIAQACSIMNAERPALAREATVYGSTTHTPPTIS